MPTNTLPRAAILVLAGMLLMSCDPARQAASGDRAGAPPGSASPATAPASPAAAPGAALPVGPGPQPAYRVQPQPSPGTCHFRYQDKQPLPDASCTPGATNPKVTQATLGSTICRAGYSSGIRPPSDITEREKTANARSYGYTGSLHDAEYDHLVSLELGGDPNDPRNLWVEPPSPDHRPGSGPVNDKDKVEDALHTAVCGHAVDLAAAQKAIAVDWTTAESALGVEPKH